MNNRCLVLGGAGFIGSHLVDLLIEEGNQVCVVDNLFLGKRENVNIGAAFAEVDATDYQGLFGIIENFKPNVVFNLAVLPLPHSLVNPYFNINVNIKIVQNLCKLLQIGIYPRLIHFSSSEVYGSAQYEPMCENHPWKPSTPYAAAKAAGDLICLSYVKTFGCNISIIRPFNAYGPRQNAGSYAGVIPLTINRILAGEAPIIYGDGSQTRDYTFVRDIAKGAVSLMNSTKDLTGEIFNVASGHDTRIDWLVERIQRLIMQKDKDVLPIVYYQDPRPGDVHRHIANVLKAKDVLNWEHETNLIDGLKETIDWDITAKG